LQNKANPEIKIESFRRDLVATVFPPNKKRKRVSGRKIKWLHINYGFSVTIEIEIQNRHYGEKKNVQLRGFEAKPLISVAVVLGINRVYI